LRLVIDSSIAISWLMPDEDAGAADRAMAEAMAEGADVPALFGFEVANVLVVNARRKRLSPDALASSLADLSCIDIRSEPAPAPDVLRAISGLAAQHGLTVYDAAYLELARRLGAPLATLDGRLREAAAAEKLSLFEP
jgi:predicted nucleic acid-binding protein